jgi:hypothetical protein
MRGRRLSSECLFTTEDLGSETRDNYAAMVKVDSVFVRMRHLPLRPGRALS